MAAMPRDILAQDASKFLRKMQIPSHQRTDVEIPAVERCDGIFYSKLLGVNVISPGHGFEFDANCVFNGHDRVCLEFECRQHGTKLVYSEGIVAVNEHVAAPVADTDDKRLYLEVGWSFPGAEDLKNPFLRVLVFRRRALRAF
jgi:hypothetical protein